MKKIKIAIIAAALLALPNALNAQERPPPLPPGCKLVCARVDGFFQCRVVCQ